MAKKIEDWELAVKEKLSGGYFGNLYLECDGYKLSYQRVLHKNKMIIVWYIDGIWRGIYSQKDNEIGIKFGRPIKIRQSAKTYEYYRKWQSKKYADAEKKRFNEEVHGWNNYFNNPAEIIRKLKLTCKEIKLITE